MKIKIKTAKLSNTFPKNKKKEKKNSAKYAR